MRETKVEQYKIVHSFAVENICWFYVFVDEIVTMHFTDTVFKPIWIKAFQPARFASLHIKFHTIFEANNLKSEGAQSLRANSDRRA
jgi:hypothetical protein